MKHKWTKNLWLRIGSLIFAAVMWIIVTNINDPIDSRAYEDVPVRMLNAHILDEANRVYEVLENTDVIERVTVRAPRSVISRISHANIIATADVNDISSLDTVAINLIVNNVIPTEVNEINSSSSILKLNIEDKATRTIPVRVFAVGEVAAGYMLGDINADPNSINISGPASLVRSVSYAAASVDVTNFTSDISTIANFDLRDTAGTRIPVDRISQTPGSVSVRIPIHEIKTVQIAYDISGTPADGYRRNGVEELSHSSIEIAGPSGLIRNYNEIRIPADVLDVSGRSESLAVGVDLSTYLPSYLRLVDPSDNTMQIYVGIEAEVTRQIILREGQLSVINMPGGYTASFTEFVETDPITLVGLQADLGQIRAWEVEGFIDVAAWMAERGMTHLEEGFFNIPVTVNLGPDITVTNTVSVLTNIRLVVEQ